MGWRGVVAMALALSGLMSGVQAQPWQPGAWRTDWWRNGATLDMDFANNRYMVSLTTPVTYTSLTQFISAVSGTFTRAGANETATGDPFYLSANQSFVSRASSATYIDSSGVMQTAAANVARADYDPLTLAYKGVLIEPVRTNYISNSTMQWSGSWPSDWSAPGYGVTATVVASGTISGMNYIDVQFLGVGDTVSRAFPLRYTNVHFGSYLNTAANTTLATSAYIGYVSGTYPSGTYKGARLQTALFNASKAYLGELNASTIWNYTGALKRVGIAGTTTSSTALVIPYFQLSYDQGESVDLTLRFAAPQTEMGASSTSFIPTTSAPVTRAADVYTSAYSGTYFDSTGTLRNAPANTPRLDYDPSTTEPHGILVEEQRTNLLLRSQLNATYWANGPDVVVAYNNALSPMGDTSAATATVGSGIANRWINSAAGGNGASIAAGTTYSYSIFVKPDTSVVSMSITVGKSNSSDGAIAYYMLSGNGSVATYGSRTSGTYIGSGIQPVGAGWYRLWVAAQTSSSTSGHVILSIPNTPEAVAGTSWKVWGAQIELGSFPTSYIPTSGSTVTRPADVFTIPTNTGWYTQGQGTLLGNGQVPMAGNMYSGIVALDNGGTNNSIQELLSLNGSSHIAIEVWNGGAFNGTGGGSLAYTTPGDLMKAGAAFDAVDFRGVFNGSLLDNNTRAVPTMSVLRVGNGRGGLFNLNGWARRIVYLPTREPDYTLPDYTR